MKILFLHTASILGGSERAFLDLLSGLPAAVRADCVVVLPSPGPLEGKIKAVDGNIDLLILPFPPIFRNATRKWPLTSLAMTLVSAPALFRYVFALKRLAAEYGVDLVYSNGIKCHILTLVLKKLTGAKLVWHLQDYFPEMGYVKSFIAQFAKGPDLAISNSVSVQNAFERIVPKPWGTRSITVHNSLDPGIYRCRGRPPEPDPVVISMVGMLTRWKGQHVFLESAALVHQRFPGVHFLVVGEEVYQTAGEGGYKSSLIDFVKQRGLTAVVEFRGFTENVVAVFEETDIVVHASVQPEPFGRVIIEAMACERPVIASRAGGVVEIIQDGVSGVLSEPGDPVSLARSLEHLITHADLRTKIGQAARQRVIENFSSRVFSRQIQQAMEVLFQ